MVIGRGSVLGIVALCTLSAAGCGVERGSFVEEADPIPKARNPAAGETPDPAATPSGFAAPVVANGAEVFTRVLRDVTTPVVVSLTEQTVFCTARGYGSVELKISVPDLDWLAHFNHRVEGEGLPCMTGGACTEALQPASIIEPGAPLATTSVRVLLTEEVTIDRSRRTCVRLLQEDITSDVRGRRFVHQRSGSIAPSDFDTCAALVTL